MTKMKYAAWIAVILATVALASPALAEDAPAGVQTFGVVDTSKVLRTSEAAKGIFGALEGKRKEFQAQIAKEEDKLRADGQKFEKEKATLTKEQAEARHKEIEQKLYNGQKMVQERKALLDRTFNDSMMKLKAETAKIVAEIAKEKGYSAVFAQEAVLLSSPTLDMTDEVIKRLNDKVKSIPIDWSAAKAEGKGKN
jgi:outer membrane protein